MNPTSANSPTPSSRQEGRASRCQLWRSPCGHPPPPAQSDRKCALPPAGRPEATSSQPTGVPAGPAASCGCSRNDRASPSPPLQGFRPPLLHFGSREWSSASVNLFIPHTEGQDGSDEDSSGKGNWAPLPAPRPQESRAVTPAPGHHARRPAGRDRAETLKSAACAC